MGMGMWHSIRTTAAPYPHNGRTLSAQRPHLIRTTGSFRRVWDMLMAVLLLYTAFFTPFQVRSAVRSLLRALPFLRRAPFLPARVAHASRPPTRARRLQIAFEMHDEELSAMFFINLLVDFCFMFDMLLNFVTIVEVRWPAELRISRVSCRVLCVVRHVACGRPS
jgi:hypothetical protein